MKVLHLLSSDRYSGAENVVCQIISAVQGTPDVEAVYCSPDGPIADTLRARGIPFVPLCGMSVREVRRALAEVKPDVLHAHDMRASLIGALAAPRRVALVSHIHNNNTDARRLSVRSLTYLFAARRAARILWVSDSAMNDYRFAKLVRGKSEVLYNIVDKNALEAAARRAERQEDYDVIFLGRLMPVKDPMRFLSVMRAVKEGVSTLRAAMVGAGEMEAQVREAIVEMGLDGTVDALGFFDNPYGLLSRAKVMVMTSVYEGMPMAALEATALGVPIVGTPVDGLRALVREGENGCLSSDDAALCEKITALVTDGELRARMHAEQLRVAEERFDTDAYRTRLLALWHRAAEKKTKKKKSNGKGGA